MKKIEGNFQGYIWWSDKSKPEVFLDKEFNEELDESKNPFIVEGQLFDKESLKSYSIKYVDGKYILNEYIVKKEELKSEDIQLYLPNRMDEVKELKFLQRWEEKEDPLCEGMSVLQPAEFIFVGFNRKEK